MFFYTDSFLVVVVQVDKESCTINISIYRLVTNSFEPMEWSHIGTWHWLS